MQTYSDREQISGCQGGRWGEVGGGTIKEHMETSGGDEQWWFHRCINKSMKESTKEWLKPLICHQQGMNEFLALALTHAAFFPLPRLVYNCKKPSQVGHFQNLYPRSWMQEKLIDPHSYQTPDFSFINIIFSSARLILTQKLFIEV